MDTVPPGGLVRPAKGPLCCNLFPWTATTPRDGRHRAADATVTQRGQPCCASTANARSILVMQAPVHQRPAPDLGFGRIRVWRRTPVRRGRRRPRAPVPRTNPAIEIARLVDAFRLCRELVDHGGVEGVLPLPRSLGVAIFAAPLAKEIAPQSRAVGASSAAALCDQDPYPAPARSRPPPEASAARARVLPVLLDMDRIPATLLNAAWSVRAVGSGLEDVGWKGAAQLGKHVIEIHDGLLFRFEWPTRAASAPERAACARWPVTSRQRGRSAAQNPRLTGQARMPRLPATDGAVGCGDDQRGRPPRREYRCEPGSVRGRSARDLPRCSTTGAGSKVE